MSIDRLLPAKLLSADAEELRRARLVLYALLLALGATLCAATLLYLSGYVTNATWVLASSILYLGVFGLLWVGSSALSASHAIMFVLFTVVALDFGPGEGYGVMAAVTLPLAATALIGVTSGLIWMVVGVVWAALLGPVWLRPDVPMMLGVSAGIMTLVVGTGACIIEYTRQRAAREGDIQRRLLQEGQSRLLAFAENTFPGLVVVSAQGTEYASAGVKDLVGHAPEEFAATPFEDYIHPDDRGRLQSQITSASNGFRDEIRIRHKNGEWVWLEVYAIPDLEGTHEDQWIFAARDVQHERRSREQLLQAQRLEGLGVMAAGIAHDFNNLLSIVIGRATLLARGEDRDQILLAATQAASLTESLTAFGKKGSKLVKTISVNDVLERLQPMFNSLFGDNRLEVTMDKNLQIRLTDGQLEQVLLNLVTNAREAIDGIGGRVRVNAGIEYVPEAQARSMGVNPGRYVVLSVADNGAGMTDEVKNRAFEPFYSTKPPHEGSGLGLAGAYGIVRESGGYIDIESQRGQGTRISAYFPLAPATVKVEQPETVSTADFSGLTCLLVEDEEEVRQVMQKHLALLGFNVFAADNAERALALCHEVLPDVVVTDVIMPGMRGTDLAAQLREAYPSLPVLLVSGYGSDQVMSAKDRYSTQQQGEFRRFLAKPFRLPELQSKLAELVST